MVSDGIVFSNVYNWWLTKLSSETNIILYINYFSKNTWKYSSGSKIKMEFILKFHQNTHMKMS